MAVTYDVGEWNDLHPLDKASVGKRLAFVARKVVYGKNIVYTGPSLREIKKTEDGYRLFYDNQGSGLTTTNNQPLRHFVLVDADGTSTEADAVIDGNTIILKAASPKDSDKPYTECRYAYAANQETANLCNKEGFPAAPFRKMLT